MSVAAPGPGVEAIRSSPIGKRRLKSGAALQHVRADAEHWHTEFVDNDPTGRGLHLLLENPTVAETSAAFESVATYIKRGWKGEALWGGQFGFAFSGHGGRDGTVCLKDGSLRVADILPDVAEQISPKGNARLMSRLFLDSCHAGAAVGHALESLPRSVSLRDAYAAALHDEEAGEYDELGHGLMTYAAKLSTPLHERGELIDKLIRAGAWKVASDGSVAPREEFEYPDDLAQEVRTSLVDFDLLPFLSGGGQHVLDVMNDRVVTVRGRGVIDLADEFDADEVDSYTLFRLIEDLCRAPLDLGIRSGR